MNTTRRYPRTMQEAFGPYTARELYAPTRRLTSFGRFVRTVIVLMLFATIGALMAC